MHCPLRCRSQSSRSRASTSTTIQSLNTPPTLNGIDLEVYPGDYLVIVSAMHFVELLFLTSLLTNTTTLADITHGMENMLRPFSRIGVPSHELSLVATIALRFVPLLAEQLEIIMKAQASRGADIAHKGRLQFMTTARQVAALIVPLFIDAFRRA